MTESDRRLLLISHNFPPTLGPESVLVQLNTRSLHQQGWDVTALTTTRIHGRQQVDEGLLRDLPKDMEVLRAPSWDAYIRTMLPRIGNIINYKIEQRYLPEPFFLWRGPARRMGLRWLKQHSPAILYSRAQKFVSNVVGLDLKRATGLPWIAHFSDPWVEMMKRQTHPKPIAMVHDLERAILEEADSVVFVTQQTVDVVMRRYPDHLRSKVMVIPHGYDKASAPPSNSTPTSGPLKAIHAGAFYHGYREPHVLFKGIAKLHAQRSLTGRFELLCVGPDTCTYQSLVDELGIGSIVKLLEAIPFEECQNMIASSHVLVVVDTPGYNGLFLPTKVIEYFAHEKPVLGLAEPGSAVAEALQRCEQACANTDSPDQVADILTTMLAQWEAGGLAISETGRTAMRGYEISNVNQPLFAKLDELQAQLRKR